MSHSMVRKIGYLGVFVSLKSSFSHIVTATMLVPLSKGMEKNFLFFRLKWPRIIFAKARDMEFLVGMEM